MSDFAEVCFWIAGIAFYFAACEKIDRWEQLSILGYWRDWRGRCHWRDGSVT